MDIKTRYFLSSLSKELAFGEEDWVKFLGKVCRFNSVFAQQFMKFGRALFLFLVAHLDPRYARHVLVDIPTKENLSDVRFTISWHGTYVACVTVHKM